MFPRARLQVEQLGERLLPSTTTSVVTLYPLYGAELVPPLPTTSTHAMAGQAQGGYIGSRTSLLSAVTYTLNGTADLNALGHTTVHGTVHSVGLVALGAATGTLTFTNSLGSVTMSIAGPTQGELAALPQQFTYTVVSGTGTYAHVRDTGTLTLALAPAPAGTTPPSLYPQILGTFTMSIAGGFAVRPTPAFTSGIAGLAVAGPTTPAALVSPTLADTTPLAGAVLDFEAAAGGPVLAQVTTAANGSFSVALPPGEYRIVPLPLHPGMAYPSAVTALTVTVTPGTYTDVLVSYDTGIR